VSKPWWLVVVAAVLGVSVLGGWVVGRVVGGGDARTADDPAIVGAGDMATVIVGAGDIASCSGQGDEATARLLANTGGTVFTTGDNAYPDGTYAQFAECYGPSWGRFKDRTRPAVGNHEYDVSGAEPYFGYFGARAGPAGKGYYSYDRGGWHVVVLNSNCWEVPCVEGSAQQRWLENDLAANSSRCTLAYFHYPRFSSGGNNKNVAPFWEDLYEAGADVVVNGHSHSYERFAPQRPDGTLDRERGIREFVVGTGGGGLNPLKATKPNSQARNDTTYGVLKLTLHPGSYEWKFVPVAGKTFTDSGTEDCH
jgi:acid phosphatase type 7